MNYPRIFLIIGLSIAIVPFLGIPLVWKHIVTVLLGASVIALAILLRSALRGTKNTARPEASKTLHAVSAMSESTPHSSISHEES